MLPKTKITFEAIFVYCSRGRIRTDDQLVNSQLRYRCATREYFQFSLFQTNHYVQYNNIFQIVNSYRDT